MATAAPRDGSGDDALQTAGIEEVRLSQDLTLFDITMLGIGALMGGGVFVLLGLGAGVAGPGILLAFFLNGLITIPTMMIYAQLGSGFPDAGGGYLWIKEALRQPWGFLGGWMDWFSHAVACAVYCLASGFFLSWILEYLDLAPFGMESSVIIVPSAVLFCLAFVALNYVGVKQSVGIVNAINGLVLGVVLVFLASGIWRLSQNPEMLSRNFIDFLPAELGGAFGVFAAMGLTFIAFEGYEIISQSSEEVKSPKRNIPRAIFVAMLSVWAIILVTTTVTLALVEPVPSWRFLGERGPLAIVDAAPFVLPASWGAFASLIMLTSALLLQLVGLNATIYSSSRVSLAMGRDGNLPRFLAAIHRRYRTPHWSILASGAIIVVMALFVPIERVAVAAALMFVLLFLLVDASYIKLHRTMPAETFGYRAPFFPALPLVGIAGLLFLTFYLFAHDLVGSLLAVGWILVGLGFYTFYVKPGEKKELVKEREREVLHDTKKGQRKDFRILVPLANPANVPGLALAARDIAKGLDAEIIFLNIVRVPDPTPLREGARFVADAKPLFEIAERTVGAKVPIHTVVRIGHDVGQAIRNTAEEKGASLLLIGWRGDRRFSEFVFGGTLDGIIEDPPCDVAVLKLRGTPPPGKILVPTHGGGHAPLSIRLAGAIARARGAHFTLYNAIAPEEEHEMSLEARKTRGRALMTHADLPQAQYDIAIEHSGDIIDSVLKKGKGYDLLVVGATTEPAWRNYLFGHKPELITERFQGSVLMVKGHMGKRSATLRRLGRRLRGIVRLLRRG